ncbi:hypothetical protein EU513_06560 [Yimella sp. RIT 621]|nr:hypothetical protein EU513_06560 [Yimella sp. RIT 621]
MPDTRTQQDLAKRVRDLHDDFLILPNAWDAGSAHLIAQTGAAAIATSGRAGAIGLPARHRAVDGPPHPHGCPSQPAFSRRPRHRRTRPPLQA